MHISACTAARQWVEPSPNNSWASDSHAGVQAADLRSILLFYCSLRILCLLARLRSEFFNDSVTVAFRLKSHAALLSFDPFHLYLLIQQFVLS